MNFTSQQRLLAEPALLNQVQSAIIKCLLYFDVFNHPLTISEIFEHCAGKNLRLSEVEKDVRYLLEEGFLFQTGGFYYLSGRSSIVDYRLKVNAEAQHFWPKAYTMSGFISGFPFVEGVFITGSLAKNCMNEDSDIDYLIITRPGRLWLCRALLTTYKKLFLLNQRKYFCVNYYLSSDALAIPDENIFTATEITSAVPVYNEAACKCFYKNNQWISRYYPNKAQPDFKHTHTLNKSWHKRLSEYLLNGWAGTQLDLFSFKLFVWRWKKKFRDLDPSTFEINFRSRRHVSKHHPQGFQLKVLAEYREKIKTFENEYSVNLL